MDGSQEDTTMAIAPDDTPASGTYIPPSVQLQPLVAGHSYAHYSFCPPEITVSPTKSARSEEADSDSIEPPPTPCVLGVDEAGRGPVLGPMVYSAFYLPLSQHHSLLTTKDHPFDDSKALTPAVRSNLMRLICTPDHPLHSSGGWAAKVMSARDISAGMLRPGAGAYNLNAQAMDATEEIIRAVVDDRRVDVKEVYIDTVGNPQSYQKKLERLFPALDITVAKKADSLYPCVSAASVCAKVTRDAALEACYKELVKERTSTGQGLNNPTDGWGSGYPSDSKCVNWLKKDMDALFGWGSECRFSWGTAKEMLETKTGTKVNWPVEQDEEAQLMTQFFVTAPTEDGDEKPDELRDWYGHNPKEVF